MSTSKVESRSLPARRGVRILCSFTLTLLAIELLDEVIDGAFRASWPFIRQDLSLSYSEIGFLMTVPAMCANLFIEPVVGILADVWRRRALVVVGGIAFTAALVLTAASTSFTVLLVAFFLFNPASGAFVNTSQAVLMDSDPRGHEHNMARWTFAGSLGNVIGPFALGLFLVAGAGWRALYFALALFSVVLVIAAWRSRFAEPSRCTEQKERTTFVEGVRGVRRALARSEVVRWLVLLETADFLQRGLQSYLALYFVDVAALTEAQAGFAITVWMTAGLPGDFLLMPLLKRVNGLRYLRWSAAAVLCLFSLFLLATPLLVKLVLVGLLGFSSAGWYAILKAQLYSSMPGQSGTVSTLGNVSGLAGDMLPLALGLVAERFGLEAAMWLLIASPAALLLLIPRARKTRARSLSTNY